VETPNRQYFYAGTDVKGNDVWTAEESDMYTNGVSINERRDTAWTVVGLQEQI